MPADDSERIDDVAKAEEMAYAGKHAEDYAAEISKAIKEKESKLDPSLDGPGWTKVHNLEQVRSQAWDNADRAEEAAGKAYDEEKAKENTAN